MTYVCRRKKVTGQCKTFLATSRLLGGVIRIVIVKFKDGSWAPYFCTDPQVDVVDILETVAGRWGIEEHFHDVKEVWGAAKQQVRNLWSTIGCWNLNQWMYTVVELCSWDASQARLSDRSDHPWDNPDRRPSHADRRRAFAWEMLEKHFLSHLPTTPDLWKIRQLIQDIISLAA